jgi:hypothetical protein
LYLISKEIINKKFVIVLILLSLGFIDLYLHGSSHTGEIKNPMSYYTNRDLTKKLNKLCENNLFRIKTREGNLILIEQNQELLDNIFVIDGYNPLNLINKYPPSRNKAELYSLLNVVYMVRENQNTKKMDLVTNPDPLPRFRMLYNPVTISNSDEAAKFMISDSFDYKKMVVLEKKVDISAPDSNTLSNIKLIKYSLNEIELKVETNKAGILYASEVYYPNWMIYIDDKKEELLRVNYCHRGAIVKEGTHKVVFKYEDKSFTYGYILCSISLLVIILGLIIQLKPLGRKKNDKEI